VGSILLAWWLLAVAVGGELFAREDYQKRDDQNWVKHTCAWKDENWNVTYAYRPVHLKALSNEAPSVAPAERTHQAGRRGFAMSCRHCEERSDEAISVRLRADHRDCFASLAMTAGM
jgi:hypothetical protein